MIARSPAGAPPDGGSTPPRSALEARPTGEIQEGGRSSIAGTPCGGRAGLPTSVRILKAKNGLNRRITARISIECLWMPERSTGDLFTSSATSRAGSAQRPACVLRCAWMLRDVDILSLF